MSATQKYWSAAGDVYEYKGHSFKVTIEGDGDMGEPWKEHDGHGVVSDWTSRDKRPGERVLCEDRGSKRFYDVQASSKIARRDGWGLGDDDKAELLKRLCAMRRVKRSTYRVVNNIRQDKVEWVDVQTRDPNKPLTAGEIHAEAVRLDFEYLRGWCNDQWEWKWIRVEMVDEDECEMGYDDSIGGVESSEEDYLFMTVEECMDNCISAYNDARKAQADSEVSELLDAAIEDHEAAHWRDRGVLTMPVRTDSYRYWEL
jgi:hypothetical protein